MIPIVPYTVIIFTLMKKQNYQNHVQYYAPHHFLLLPLLAVAIFISAYHIFHLPEQWMFFSWITIVLVFIFWVAVMLRQHYALGNQDRIVRLEMRLRYFELTGRRLETEEKRLTFEQIKALRFAGDDELLNLMDRAVKENLSPKAIKQAIQNWQADNMRV